MKCIGGVVIVIIVCKCKIYQVLGICGTKSRIGAFAYAKARYFYAGCENDCTFISRQYNWHNGETRWVLLSGVADIESHFSVTRKWNGVSLVKETELEFYWVTNVRGTKPLFTPTRMSFWDNKSSLIAGIYTAIEGATCTMVNRLRVKTQTS